jgi:hypothetical protein
MMLLAMFEVTSRGLMAKPHGALFLPWNPRPLEPLDPVYALPIRFDCNGPVPVGPEDFDTCETVSVYYFLRRKTEYVLFAATENNGFRAHFFNKQR